MIRIANDHVSINCLSAVWSDLDQQLVAALVTGGTKLEITAIKAEIEKNGLGQLRISGDANAYLNGARRGFLFHLVPMERFNAHGYMAVLMNRRSHDPKAVITDAVSKQKDGDENAGEFFYVVARNGDDLNDLFVQRLQLAISYPVRPEWAEQLLQLGSDNYLVHGLDLALASEMEEHIKNAPDTKGLAFMAGLRVVRDSEAWGELISSAVEQDFVHI